MGWATAVSCDVACHVMSLGVLVMSFDAMWLLVLCHVTWCTAMSCDVRSCEELSSVVPCNGMECYEVKLPLFSKQLLCTTKYYSSTTPTLLQYYSVLQSTTPVLQSTTPVLQRTTLYYKVRLQYYKVLLQYYNVLLCTTTYFSVLLQYYSVLQSTSPVLLRTTKYYSSTTVYYKVRLRTTKYFSSTTTYFSELLRTTKCYSSTTVYYKVLLQYYSVLQSTTPVLQCSTPVLLRTTKYYSTTTVYYKVLLRTTKYYSSTTKYYSSTTPVLQRTTLYYKILLRYYFERSFTMRGATGISFQPHQTLRLPRKRNVMIDPHHIWNVIYNKQSNRHHPATSPNTAPATQKEWQYCYCSHMKRHLQCAERQESPSNLTKYCACHAKGMSWLIRITYETSFTMRGATGISFQPHQILRLPRKRNVMIDPHFIWNVIYNARSDRHHLATSPNTGPATQKECHDWSASHMKRHLQCAERQASPCNLTKYCACHAKGMSWLIRITYETSFTMRGATGINLQPHQILRLPRKIALPNLREIYWKQVKWHFQCATDPSMIRAWSDHDPSMIRPRKRKPQPAAPQRLLFALARSRFYWQLQRFPLRLSFQISPHAAPARKSDTWTSPNAAPATKSDTWTPPNAAPAKKSDTWTPPNAALATKSDTKWRMTTTTTTTTTTTATATATATATTATTATRTTATRTTATRTTTTRTTTTRTTTTRTTTTRTTTTRTTTTRTTTTRTNTTRTTTTRTTTTTTTRTTTTRTTTTRTTTTLGLLLLGLLLLGLLLGLLLLGLLLLGLLLLGLLLLGLLLLGLPLLGLLLLGLLLLGLLLLGLLLLGLLLLGLLLLGLLLLGLLLLGLPLLRLLLLRLLLLGLLFLSSYPKVRISEVCH